jgi:hypothetical protein
MNTIHDDLMTSPAQHADTGNGSCGCGPDCQCGADCNCQAGAKCAPACDCAAG